MHSAVTGEAADVAPPLRPSRGARAADVGLRWLPAGLLVLAGVLGLLRLDVTPGELSRYAAFAALGVLLPGTLLQRAARGPAPTLAEDLGLGFALGVALLLAVWAPLTALGRQDLLWAWPAAVVVAFAAVPRLRRHWRTPGRDPAPAWWSWGLAGVLLLLLTRIAATSMSSQRPPPSLVAPYPDSPWHVAIVAELTRSLPPQVPQEAGATLRYHWFSHAHLASAAEMTGVDLWVLLLRLWAVPVVVAAVVVIAHLGRVVSGRAVTGLLAAALTALGGSLAVDPVLTGLSSAFVYNSPSQVLVVLVLPALVVPLVDLVRDGRLRAGGWAVVVLLTALTAGAKSSGLPVVVAGAAAALAVALLRRERRRGPALALALLLPVLLVAAPAVAGGGAGVRLAPMTWLTFVPAYTLLSGGAGPPVVGLAFTATSGTLLLVVLQVLQQLPYLAGPVLLLRRRALWRDPALVLLSGAVAGGVLAMVLLAHPAASQVYFYLAAVPFGAVVLAHAGVSAAPVGRARREALVATGGVVLLAAGAARLVRSLSGDTISRAVVRSGRLTSSDVVEAALRPWTSVLLAALVAAAGWWVLRRARPAARGWGRPVSVGLLVTLPVALGLLTLLASVRAVVGPSGPRPDPASLAVSVAEQRAALWVSQHAPSEDVVATNVHCARPPTEPGCDTRSFWVSGLTQRRILVEGWAYLDSSQARSGAGGRSFAVQPYHRPERLAANDVVFTDPTPQALARLRDDEGVRWLFADRRHGVVSPLLDVLAVRRHVDGPVVVYELRQG